MKLKKLTIHNIASIEDAVIDFEYGPLADDSRFLICGPTGAGKTTLLDAICLVLYGTTPRLKMSNNEGYVDMIEKFSLGKRPDIKIDDTRMLMRRGSLSAYVELTFTDKDDIPLKASWNCSRAHNKVNGSIKDPTWTLADADDTVITCKKSEMFKIIEERIGLTFEQFCRTTMLAQGDFTRFLKSDEGQKSEILEKLTGTAIYSKISAKIYNIKVEKERVCALIKSKLEGVRMLSDDERNDILIKQDELKAKASLLYIEEQKLTAIITWMEQVQKQTQQHDKVARDYEEQRKLILADEFVRDSKLVDDWNRTAPQRELWNNRNSASKLLADYRANEIELKSKYSYLCAGLLSLQNDEKVQEERRKNIEQYLNDEKKNEESYRQINLIQSLVQQHVNYSLQIKKAHLNVETKNKEINDLIEAKKVKVEMVHKCAIDVDCKAKELDAKMHDLNKIDYHALLSCQKEKINELGVLNDYLKLIESYAQCHESLLQKEKELNTIRKDIVKYTDDLAKADAEEKNIDTQVTAQQNIYDKQLLACKDIMKEYRKNLSVGDICPLCGQKIQDISSDEHFESVLQPIKESLEELKKRYSAATKVLSDKKAILIQAKDTEKIRLNDYLNAETKDKDLLTKKENHSMYVEYLSYDNPSTVIDERKNKINIELKDIDSQLNTVGELQKMVTVIQKEKDKLEKLLHKEEDFLKDIDNRQKIASNAVATEKENIISLERNISETEEKMSQYISVDKYLTDGDNYISVIKSAADKYHKNEKLLQTIINSLQQMTSELNHIGDLKLMVEDKHDEWKGNDVIAPISVPDISTKWMKFQADVMKNDEAVKQVQKMYSSADNQLQNYFGEDNAVTENELSSLAQHPIQEIEKIRQNLQNIRDKELSTKAEMKAVETNLNTLNESRPNFDENTTHNEAVDTLNEKKKETSDVNQQLGQNKQILDNDAANKKNYAEITQQLNVANKEYERWSKLSELFGSHDGKKFRNIAQSYVLEQLLVNANQYLLQFTDRYEMICQPGSLIILLRDNESGGVIRPTTTISGGESFLISLSLALGLSSLSRASFSVDTLFIDEGFGTLDSTYLSCVMDALERLHQMGGKKIGIISHVESLKERLTTQIQVSRINNTLSKVNVVSMI